MFVYGELVPQPLWQCYDAQNRHKKKLTWICEIDVKIRDNREEFETLNKNNLFQDHSIINYFSPTMKDFIKILDLAQRIVIKLSVYCSSNSAFDFLLKLFSKENITKSCVELCT